MYTQKTGISIEDIHRHIRRGSDQDIEFARLIGAPIPVIWNSDGIAYWIEPGDDADTIIAKFNASFVSPLTQEEVEEFHRKEMNKVLADLEELNLSDMKAVLIWLYKLSIFDSPKVHWPKERVIDTFTEADLYDPRPLSEQGLVDSIDGLARTIIWNCLSGNFLLLDRIKSPLTAWLKQADTAASA